MNSQRLVQQLRSLKIERRSSAAPADPGRRIGGKLVVAAFFLVLTIGGWIAGKEALPTSADQRGTVMGPGELPADGSTATLLASGKIASDHTVRVATKVSGQVVQLVVEQGARVEQGDLLAVLEDTEYVAQRDAQRARLQEAVAELRYAQYEYERVRDLRERGLEAEREWIRVDTTLARTRARVAAARAVLTLAEKRLADCRIVAPISGTVLDRHVNVGDFVAAEGGRSGVANALIVTLADRRRVRVEVDVPEDDIARIRPSMSCAIVPDASRDRRYEGRVMWIDPAGKYSNGTVGVKVRVDSPDECLRTGGGARVEFLNRLP